MSILFSSIYNILSYNFSFFCAEMILEESKKNHSGRRHLDIFEARIRNLEMFPFSFPPPFEARIRATPKKNTKHTHRKVLSPIIAMERVRKFQSFGSLIESHSRKAAFSGNLFELVQSRHRQISSNLNWQTHFFFSFLFHLIQRWSWICPQSSAEVLFEYE